MFGKHFVEVYPQKVHCEHLREHCEQAKRKGPAGPFLFYNSYTTFCYTTACMKEAGGKKVAKGMRNTVVCLGLFLALFFTTLTPAGEVRAQTMVGAERNALILQINSLIKEINRLQALLNERRQQAFLSATTNTDGTYKTRYYNDDVETIFPVVGGELRSRGSIVPRQVDRALFNILAATLGDEVVSKYVRELRVFDDEVRDIGAFIELKAGTDEWIIGINRSVYDDYQFSSPERIDEFYQPLFVHEYAHLLAFYDDDIEDEFAERFWDSADWRHSKRLGSLSGDKRFELMSNYYFTHEDEFATDYATLHPDEDLAESFVEFVYADRLPFGTRVLDQKLHFFSDYPAFVSAREKFRSNLGL